MIKETTSTRIKLTATAGMVLTDGESYGRVVYLASGDNGEKWYEITEAAYRAEMAKLERESQV